MNVRFSINFPGPSARKNETTKAVTIVTTLMAPSCLAVCHLGEFRTESLLRCLLLSGFFLRFCVGFAFVRIYGLGGRMRRLNRLFLIFLQKRQRAPQARKAKMPIAMLREDLRPMAMRQASCEREREDAEDAEEVTRTWALHRQHLRVCKDQAAEGTV